MVISSPGMFTAGGDPAGGQYLRCSPGQVSVLLLSSSVLLGACSMASPCCSAPLPGDLFLYASQCSK